MGLENEDLIDPRKVFVYEFINQPAGKSMVKEIIGDPTTGFQFDLFTDSALHLYNEALKLRPGQYGIFAHEYRSPVTLKQGCKSADILACKVDEGNKRIISS